MNCSNTLRCKFFLYFFCSSYIASAKVDVILRCIHQIITTFGIPNITSAKFEPKIIKTTHSLLNHYRTQIVKTIQI